MTITQTDPLKQQLRQLKWSETATKLDDLIRVAEQKDMGYQTFLHHLVTYEQYRREEKQQEKRMKWAGFPRLQTLEEFDCDQQPALSRKQFHQLQELLWLEQVYNLLLLGPPGVGKTMLAVGLGIQAIEQGNKVSFITMDELIRCLNTQEISRKSQLRLKRISQSALVIIDDLMFMAMNRSEANRFFQLINQLYDQTSVIITSNKGPEDWGELLGDPAITTAILDRLLHRSEVITLGGDSQRLKNRQTIFG